MNIFTRIYNKSILLQPNSMCNFFLHINPLACLTKTTFILIVVMFISSCMPPKTPSTLKNKEEVISEIIDFMDKGYNASLIYENTKSHAYFAKADSLIDIINDTTLKIRILLDKSELLRNELNYEECIKNNYEASVLAKLKKKTSHVALAYYNLATIYNAMDNYKEADKYIELALVVIEKTQSKKYLMECNVLYAANCQEKSNFPRAKKYLDEAISLYREQNNLSYLSICYNIYANLFSKWNQYDESIKFNKKALKISVQLKDSLSVAMQSGNIGGELLKLNKQEDAYIYINNSLNLARKIDAKQVINSNLERLIVYYKSKKDFESALQITHELQEIKTNLFSLESSKLVANIEEEYKKKLDFSNAKNKIIILEKEKIISKRKLENNRVILIFIVVITSIIIVVSRIIYKKQSSIREKDKILHNQEREILIAKKNIAEYKEERLNKELKFKEKELMTFSMSLAQREEYLNLMKSIFSKISPNQIPKKEIIEELQGLLINIKYDGVAEIKNQIEEINSSFFYNLKAAHSQLTENDIRLASLLFLGLSSKEISNILTIEVRSVNQKCYRLKKKLDLKTEQDLKSYLTGI